MSETTRRPRRNHLRKRLGVLAAVLGLLGTPAITSAADPLVPGQVEITEIVRSSGKITLKWQITGPGGAATDIKYRIENPDGTDATFNVGSTASTVAITTDAASAGLVNGSLYEVSLIGTNANGDGVESTRFSVSPGSTRLAAPRITNVTSGDQFLKVEFAQDSEGLDLLQYSTDNGATWSEETAITSTSASISIATLSSDSSQTLTNGTRYTIRLRGWDTTGGYGTTGMSASAVGIPSTVPSSPEVVSVEPRGNSIVVNAELGLTGGSPITRLEYSTDNGANWSAVLPLPTALLAPFPGPPALPNKLNVPGSAFTFTITTESGNTTRISSGKSYTVVMRATNLIGTSGDSNSASADTIGANELSPAIIDSVLARGSMLIVRGTLPTLQSGVSVLRVEYSTDNGSTWRSTGQKTGNFSITSASSSASTAIAAGGEYQVRTRIVTTAGTSPASSAYPVRAGNVPAPPTITSAAVSVDGLKIVGTLGADNGAPIIRVEYSTDNGSSWLTALSVGGSASGSTGGSTGGGTTPTTVPSSSTSVPSSSTTVAPVTSTTSPATTTISRNLDFIVTAVSSNGRDPIAIGVRYVVRIRAVSAVGIGAPSAAKVAIAARTAAAPTIKDVKAEIGAFAVEATLGATNGASLTDVEYSTDNGATWLSTGQTTGNFTITSPSDDENSPLMSSRFYEIRVRVVTANGVGAASVPVTKKAIAKVHKITFPQPADKLVDAAPFAVNVSANSKLPVTVTSSTPKVCTTANSMMGAAKATVTILAPGTCTLTATRGPSGTYPAAAPVTRSFTVRTKPELAAGSPVSFKDAASLAGLPVGAKARITVKSTTPEVCDVAKRSIVAKAAGTCKVRVTVKPAKGKAATKPLTFVVAG